MHSRRRKVPLISPSLRSGTPSSSKRITSIEIPSNETPDIDLQTIPCTSRQETEYNEIEISSPESSYNRRPASYLLRPVPSGIPSSSQRMKDIDPPYTETAPIA